MRTQMAYQQAKAAKELKRDMEAILTSNQAGVAGNSTSTARKTAGLPTWLITNSQANGATVSSMSGASGNGYPSKTNKTGWVAEHNTARDLIVPFLAERKIASLDGVAISHAHYDHFGGLAWLVDNFPIKKLYDSGYNFPGQATMDYTGELGHYAKLRESFKKRGAYQEAHTGDKLDYIKAIVRLALQRPDLGPQLERWLEVESHRHP